ncbi:MAG: M99 family carboxypeptidase catalytic domain-containing protein [Campylobacterota bacterium]|nr:M99 family carboxypeptidase catalytic domain-containing protein [Campylobacterota bacterium]
MKIYTLIVLLFFSIQGWSLEFSLIKKESRISEPTLLIIGGIQGDEPGGFNAASILSTRYSIQSGNVWIVPNLNFYSIIKRSRGPYGDMNRKFASLKKSDPEYEIVQRIKAIITDDQVDLILNLHDGSGFYRPEYIDNKHSPFRWGQCCIIDQEFIDSPQYGNLKEIADFVSNRVNESLLKEEHRFHVHNTRTREGDKEMEKTLTYYAINSGKPAFGNEGSKEFGTEFRVYYHLLAVEAYMDYMGIEYERHFPLTPKAIKSVINDDYHVTLFEKITLPTQGIRKKLNYIPTDKKKTIFSSENPLICAVKEGKNYKIHYGNRKVALLSPQFFHYDDSLSSMSIEVDGKEEEIEPGMTISVENYFKVLDKEGYRVNVIGFSNSKKLETGVAISEKKIPKRFSVDKKGKIFRVEIYKDKKFSGMFLVKFEQKSRA